MIKQGIEIAWDGSREFIAIDFAQLHAHKEIASTIEWWTEEKRFVSFATSSTISAQADGSYELKIKYERKRNATLPREALFGVATVHLRKAAQTGDAFWHEEGGKPGKHPAKWKRVSIDTKAKKIRRTHQITTAERNQALFRLALLGRYRCCAISGETSVEALEAAHIVPSSKDGREYIGNGILLRADIHRLYDRGAFEILRNGSLKVSKGLKLSSAYTDLFRNARLPKEVVDDLFAP